VEGYLLLGVKSIAEIVYGKGNPLVNYVQ
jgi:hypothetical protein